MSAISNPASPKLEPAAIRTRFVWPGGIALAASAAKHLCDGAGATTLSAKRRIGTPGTAPRLRERAEWLASVARDRRLCATRKRVKDAQGRALPRQFVETGAETSLVAATDDWTHNVFPPNRALVMTPFCSIAGANAEKARVGRMRRPPPEGLLQMLLNVEMLTKAGELLGGRTWQAELARELAPYRPDSNSPIDDSLVRKWKRGERPIPAWVEPALADLLAKRAKRLSEMSDEAARLAKRLAPRR